MELYFSRAVILTRMRNSIFGNYLNLLAARLNEQGYALATAQRQLSIVAGFGDWLQENRVSLPEIVWEHTRKYIAQRSQRKVGGVPIALANIMKILDEHGVIDLSPPKKTATPIEKLVGNYTNYLHQERRLKEWTARYYSKIAEQFLVDSVATTGQNLSDLRSVDIIQFIQRQALKHSRGRTKLIATVLRSFLQYARYQGFVVDNLDSAVPIVANWSMTEIPKAMLPEQLKELLSRTSSNAVSDRDFAILMLLSQLGLRAGEIVSLLLEDIDWERATITVRGKGGRDSVMPLLSHVGEAIASYLQNERPKMNARALFLTSQVPYGALSSSSTVSELVTRAIACAGINTPRKGAHQLRHSLACRVLNDGFTLPEVGELLRHQNIQTTTIYAKVNLKALQTLAQPWPIGAK